MKILILGMGKMGLWLYQKLSNNNQVWFYDNALVSAPTAASTRIYNLKEAKDINPEMVLNCVPLGLTIEAFTSVLPYVSSSCLLSDIASVKTSLADYYPHTALPFVSTHPMFGPTLADMNNTSQESAIIIKESCAQGKDFFSDLYVSLGIHVYEYSFEEHDRTMAYSLSLPFVSSLVFAACMVQPSVPGTNFKKHLSIAEGLLSEDDRLLSEILFNPHTTRQLELVNSQLSYLSHIIKQHDNEEMIKYLDSVRKNITPNFQK